MIKILKEGTKRKVKCDGCGAVLRFDKSDVETEDVGYLADFVESIHCPQCGHKIII